MVRKPGRKDRFFRDTINRQVTGNSDSIQKESGTGESDREGRRK